MRKLALILLGCASVQLYGFNNGCFNVTGEFLYWKPHVSGLELYAGNDYITQIVDSGTTITYMTEYDFDHRFDWNAGVRVGLDYQFCSGMDTALIWTHIQDSGTKHYEQDATTTNFTRCRIKFDQLDLVAGYQTPKWFGFDLKPTAGVRWVKVREGINANIVANITLVPGGFATLTRTFHDHQDSDFVGPVAGICGNCDLRWGMEFYGSAAVSVLYGDHKVTFNDSAVITPPISRFTFSYDRRHLHTIDWNVDLAVGLVWRTLLCRRYSLAFNLGFEHHQYFNQSHLSVNRGDLTFDGGVFGINLGL